MATPSKAAKIVVVDMSVDTPKSDVDHPTRPTRPVSLDIKVLNTGTQRSILKEATVTILKFSLLEACAGQGGGLDVSATYGLRMPAKPTAGQELKVPLSQQIGPDEADRFKLNLRLPKGAEWIAGGPDLGKLFIYDIRVHLIRDEGDDKVKAGEAVVVLPDTVSTDGDLFFYTQNTIQYTELFERVSDFDEVKRCMKSNNAILREFMSVNGAKPSWFSEIEPFLATH